MFDIIELSNKSKEELVAIAKELSVRKPESLDKETLVYSILDEQAIQSKESPVKKQRKKNTKKSGNQENAKKFLRILCRDTISEPAQAEPSAEP